MVGVFGSHSSTTENVLTILFCQIISGNRSKNSDHREKNENKNPEICYLARYLVHVIILTIPIIFVTCT